MPTDAHTRTHSLTSWWWWRWWRNDGYSFLLFHGLMHSRRHSCRPRCISVGFSLSRLICMPLLFLISSHSIRDSRFHRRGHVAQKSRIFFFLFLSRIRRRFAIVVIARMHLILFIYFSSFFVQKILFLVDGDSQLGRLHAAFFELFVFCCSAVFFVGLLLFMFVDDIIVTVIIFVKMCDMHERWVQMHIVFAVAHCFHWYCSRFVIRHETCDQ